MCVDGRLPLSVVSAEQDPVCALNTTSQYVQRSHRTLVQINMGYNSLR